MRTRTPIGGSAAGPRLPLKVEGLLDAMRRAIAGERAGLEVWMRDDYPILVRTLARWTRSGDLGERIALGIVEVVFRRCTEGIEVVAEREWMRKVAVLERYKLHRSDRPSDEFPVREHALPEETPLRDAERMEQRERVWRAIGALPARYRWPMRLRYLRGRSLAEVTTEVSSTRGVGQEEVRRLLKEGLKMLGAILRGEDPRQCWPRRYARKKRR